MIFVHRANVQANQPARLLARVRLSAGLGGDDLVATVTKSLMLYFTNTRGSIKSLNLGAACAPRMAQAASHSQASRVFSLLLLFSFVMFYLNSDKIWS